MTDPEHFVANSLREHYEIELIALSPLNLGADLDSFLYKAQGADRKVYFIKVKRGLFQSGSIEIINLLERADFPQLISPIKTLEGKQMHQEGGLTLIVYPYIEGTDGFGRQLTEEQWIAFGRALKQLHAIRLPPRLESCIRREDFSSIGRAVVRSFYSRIDEISCGDEIAARLYSFLIKNRCVIEQMVSRSEELSKNACSRHFRFVLCHSDIHAGNILMEPGGLFYIVDWDSPMLAPKERDLMFIGGGVGRVWNEPSEEKLFYQGYGQVELDNCLLAYYRYERIVEDIAEYIRTLIYSSTNEKDREVMYGHFMDMFAAKGVVDVAFATDKYVSF